MESGVVDLDGANSMIVVVPDIVHPTLCYKSAEDMTRCTHPKGHRGPHTWEAVAVTGKP